MATATSVQRWTRRGRLRKRHFLFFFFSTSWVEVKKTQKRRLDHLNVLIKSGDVLLLSKAWRHLIRPESVRFQRQLFDLDERVGESAVLHQQRALADPDVQRAGQLAVFTVFPLRFLQHTHKKKYNFNYKLFIYSFFLLLEE